MAKLERVYNIPLRQEYMKAPRHKRTPKAVRALKEFAVKHMKSDNIVIGTFLNELLWKDGIKNPPHHVKVNMIKDDAGKVTVELIGKPTPGAKEEKKDAKKAAPVKTKEEKPKEEPPKAEKETPTKKSEEPKTTEQKQAPVTPQKEKQATSEGQ